VAKCPFVAVRTDIRKEERVLVIAEIAGYNRHEAIGRLVDLWAWCTDRHLQDAPDDCEGYAVSEQVICRFLGPLGVRAILGDSCEALALGELRPDGLIYLRGTSETVTRLRNHRATSSAGGIARSNTNTVTRRGGRFGKVGDISPAGASSPTSRAPAAHQPRTSRAPAATSEHPPSTIHHPEEELSLEPSAPRPPGDFRAAVAAFDSEYERAYGTKPSWDAKRGKQVKSLLRSHKPPEIAKRAAFMFSGGLQWPPGPYDLEAFVKHFDKCVPSLPSARARDPTVGRVEPNQPEAYPNGELDL
jgi:hypothetical protein